jgi:hypothetical protein
MKHIISAIALLLITSVMSQDFHADESDKSVDLFLEGCHLDAPMPKGVWLGLYPPNVEHKSIVSKVILNTKKQPADVDDLFEYCVQTKPRSTLLKDSGSPIIFLSGIIKEGIFTAAQIEKNGFDELKGHTYVGGERIPPTDEDIQIKLNNNKYIFHQTTKLDDHAEGNNHILKLSHNGLKQTILSIRGNYEGATGLKILWAGDIDSDGNLDLILDAPWHYAQPHHLRIFLSSLAKNGDLVLQAGDRGFSGI